MMNAVSSLAGLGSVWMLGCGNMGGALLHRWVAGGLTDVTVIDPAPRGLPEGVAAGAGPPAGEGPDILVVAVKPQLLGEAAAPVVGRLKSGTLVVSIMAGVGIAAISAAFGGRDVVRTMPNTPARLGQGITALYATSAVGRQVAEALMRAAGACVWLDDEAQFDAVTGVSGSGPAYVFAFIEALALAGVAAGLPADLAAQLALHTVSGAGALAALREASPSELREAVTSKNGTTAAGLTVLVPALAPLLVDTVAAAARRSRELGEGV